MTAKTGKTVMIVEDDGPMAAVLRTLLEIEGYQVEVAPDRQGLESVLAAIRASRPDLILLDVHLRQISGYDILQRVRAEPEIASVRVIMSSGMDVEERCLAVGADGFLLKPFMPDELMQKLQGNE